MRHCIAAAVLLSWLLVPTKAGAGTIIIEDGTFNNADWSLRTTGTDASHTTTLSQVTSGGNPGSYQQMQFDLGSDSSTGVYGYAFYTAQTYDPATQGAITSIDFSEDHKQSADLGGGLALVQNGELYASPFNYFSGNDQWTKFGVTDLTLANFQGPAGQPDFSATGTSIAFGYYFARYSPPGIVDGGADNWTVTLHTAPAVPEPPGLLLAASAAAFALLYGWLRRG